MGRLDPLCLRRDEVAVLGDVNVLCRPRNLWFARNQLLSHHGLSGRQYLLGIHHSTLWLLGAVGGDAEYFVLRLWPRTAAGRGTEFEVDAVVLSREPADCREQELDHLFGETV